MIAITKQKTKKKEFKIYSGLDSFDENSLDREIDLLKEMGLDAGKLRNKFNPLQLSEIRKGLADHLDVNQYLNPNLSWLDMEEIRLELYQGIDMTTYRKQGFDTQQIFQIRKGLVSGVDVSLFAKKEYLPEQMREIRKGLTNDPDFPVIFYLDPAFDHLQMREIRKGLEASLDVSDYARVDMPYMKMRAIRESAEDGLYFDREKIERFSYSILDQLHKAYVNDVDISRYISEHYDAEQIEEISIALKEDLPIDDYISADMRSDAIREVRLGIENGIPVDAYADAVYNWQQMREIRLGLEHQIDVTVYAKPLYWANQMMEIRLGLEDGLDVSNYTSMMYTAKDMQRIREQMLAGEYIDKGILNDITDEADDETGLDKDKRTFLAKMLANKDSYISFTHGHMLCWMIIPTKPKKGELDIEMIKMFLKRCNIKYGIEEQAISKMLSHPGEKYLIAAGIDAVNGTDGYYEYCFDTNNDVSLKENEDGTIDFSNIDNIIKVTVGKVVAIYHKATTGTDGCDVYGNVISAKRGHEIPILKGEGFMILNDRVTYVAKYTGALSFDNGIINIQKILVLSEVKITDKIVRYDGTVLVTGDVNSGSEIHATGDVVVSGHMESSTIVSGGNVAIKGGVKCPVRGGITAKGDVTAKYLEGVRVNARNVYANTMINCTITAKENIKLLGKDGVAYGGTLQSGFGFEGASVGSKGGVKTIINLGLTGEVLGEYQTLKKDLLREEEEYNTLNTEKERLQEIGAVGKEMMLWKIKINAAVGMKERRIKEITNKLKEMDTLIKDSNNAKAVITDYVYNGVIFVMAGVIHKIEEDRKAIDKMTIKIDARRENIVIV